MLQDWLTKWRYKRLLKAYKVPSEDLEGLRLYVLVDDSILPRGGAKSAQITHAVVELMKHHYASNERVKTWADTDRTLIILAAAEAEITRHLIAFREQQKAAEGFFEPDLGDRLTVAAFEPLRGMESEIFAHLNLAR